MLMQDLFSFDYGSGDYGATAGRLVPTGITPNFLDKLDESGVTLGSENFRPGAS